MIKGSKLVKLKNKYEKKKVSIIVPTFNSARTIGECVDALLKQNYPADKYEIIIVDDGSNDNTAEILKSFNIRYHRQDNKGPATARNKGVEMAEGEIVAFTDADCIPDSNWISEIVLPLESPEIVGVKGAYRTTQTSLWVRFAQAEFNERYRILSHHKYIDMVSTYSAAYKKSVFLLMGGFDVSFPFPNHEDTDLSYRMAQRGYKMVFNPKAVVAHLNHPNSFFRYTRLKFWRGYWRMIVYRKYPNKIMKDTYTPQTLKLQILFIFQTIISLSLALFYPSVMILFACLGLFFYLATCSPFVISTFRQDSTVALLSPFFLCVRALSIGTGVLYSIISKLFEKDLNP